MRPLRSRRTVWTAEDYSAIAFFVLSTTVLAFIPTLAGSLATAVTALATAGIPVMILTGIVAVAMRVAPRPVSTIR